MELVDSAVPVIKKKGEITLTIQRAVQIKAEERRIEKIISDFKNWFEPEVAHNILHDEKYLAKFILDIRTNVFKYEDIKIIIPEDDFVKYDLISRIMAYIITICGEFNFKLCNFDGTPFRNLAEDKPLVGIAIKL